jgi:autotransporter-associated beta strand protein
MYIITLLARYGNRRLPSSTPRKSLQKSVARHVARRLLQYRPHIEVLEDRRTRSAVALDNQQILQTYGRIPLSFEANEGQVAAPVDFLARGGYTLLLAPTGAVLSLHEPGAKTSVVTMQLVGANPRSPAVGQEQLATRSNYFVGDDPAAWKTNIPSFGQVAYQNAYPGIDLSYYGNQRQLEYDFLVNPGADPGVIRLHFQGTDSLGLDPEGNLILHTPGGDVLQHAPILYQETAGVRQNIPGRFTLKDTGDVEFAVGPFDHHRALTIDPVLSYSSYLGGSLQDFGNAIAVDGGGNAYVTGHTSSTDFPLAIPVGGSVNDGDSAFIVKMNAAGTAVVYSDYLGGSGYDTAFGIAVDAAGNAYVTGQTSSTDFPTTPGAFQESSGGFDDAFVTQLNPDGTLGYSTYLGGEQTDGGLGIAADALGNAYVTGYTNSTHFPTTAGAWQTVTGGGVDGFVTKLSSTGTVIYSTYLGGGTDDYGNGITIDGAGNAFVTGSTNGEFTVTRGAFQSSYGGQTDAFVAQLNAAGTGLVYSTYLGGTSDEAGQGIAVDGGDNAYVTGWTHSTDFPVANPFQATKNSAADAFVSKLNSTGSGLVYSSYLGGSADDRGQGIAVDGLGNAYLTGFTLSADFPILNPIQEFSVPGTYAFVTMVSPVGALAFSTYFGTGAENGQAIAVDGGGNAYLTGWTGSVNFSTTQGAFQTTKGGGEDAFVSKIAVLPATDTWTGAGPDANWSDSANWDRLPQPGDALVFPTGTGHLITHNDLAPGTSFYSLQFGDAYTVSGNSLALENAITNTTGAGTVTLQATLTLAGNVSITTGVSNTLKISASLATAGFQLTVDGTGFTYLIGAVTGTGGVTLNGSGNLILENRANTYSGATTINGGNLALAANNALGASANITVNPAGTLALVGINYNTAIPITLAGGRLAGANFIRNQNTFAGAITLTAASSIVAQVGTTFTLTGAISNGGNLLTVGGKGTTVINGLISGSGGLTQSNGQLTLTANNPFTGPTTVGGTLVVNGSQPSSAVTVSTGGLLAGTGTVGAITASGGTVEPRTPGRHWRPVGGCRHFQRWGYVGDSRGGL